MDLETAFLQGDNYPDAESTSFNPKKCIFLWPPEGSKDYGNPDAIFLNLMVQSVQMIQIPLAHQVLFRKHYDNRGSTDRRGREEASSSR